MHFTMYFCDIYMYINTRMKMRNYVCSRILFEGKEDGRGRVCHAAYSVCSIWMRYVCVRERKKGVRFWRISPLCTNVSLPNTLSYGLNSTRDVQRRRERTYRLIGFTTHFSTLPYPNYTA